MSLSIQAATTVIGTTELRGVPLKTGQVLSAIVLEANQRSGQALLSLAGGQVRVNTQQPLTAGSAIRLAVQEVGPPLRLSILPENTPAPADTANTPNAAILNRLLGALAQRVSQGNTAFAQQPSQSLPESSANASNPSANALRTPTASIPLTGATPASPIPVSSLPSGLQRALLSLDGQHEDSTAASNNRLSGTNPEVKNPDAPRPEPARLAQALSALVRHNSLPPTAAINAASPAASAVHTALHRAAIELRQTAIQTINAEPANQPTPSSPATTAPSAAVAQWLNQLETSQLRSAIQQLSGQASWLVDLPVQQDNHAHRLQLAIHHDAPDNRADSDAAPWQLEFALDLPNLGAVHGSIRLHDNRLSVRLYADQPAAETALRSELPKLDQHLRAAHFSPDALGVYAGPPPAAVRDRLTPPLSADPTRLTLKV